MADDNDKPKGDLPAGSGGPARLNVWHLFGLMLLQVALGAALLRYGYGFGTVPMRVIVALFVTIILGIVFTFAVRVDIGWVRASGAFGAFVAVFLLTKSAGPQDDLDTLLPPITRSLAAIDDDDRVNYPAYLEDARSLQQGMTAIEQQRPIVWDFVGKAPHVYRWKRNLLSQIAIEYNAAERKPNKEGYRELREKTESLYDYMQDEPLFAVYYAAVFKRAIEYGIETPDKFKSVEQLLSTAKLTDRELVGDAYRTAANTARRIAENCEDPQERHDFLAKAKGLLITANTRGLRPIDEILNEQSFGDIAEISGDYKQAVAYHRKAIDMFNSSQGVYARAKEENMPQYQHLVVEYVRVMAESGGTLEELSKARELLDKGSSADFVDLANLYICLRHPDYYQAVQDSLLTNSFNDVQSAWFDIVRGLDQARQGNQKEAKDYLHRAWLHFQQAKEDKESGILKAWIERISDGKTIEENFYDKTRWPVTQ